MKSDTRFEMKTPSLPKVPRSIRTYKTTVPSTERQREKVKTLGKSLGLRSGLKGYSDIPMGISVEEGNHVLMSFQESGAVWYGDRSKLWEEKTEPMDYRKALGVKKKTEASKEAKRKAESFLKKNKLLPKQAYYVGTEESEFAQVEKGEKGFGTPLVTGMQTNFGFKLDDIPVVGPGSKISVTLGSDGKIVGLFKAWRDVRKGEELPLLPPEKALEKLRESRLFADLEKGSKVVVNEFYLAHYASPVPERQDYLYPVYVVRGQTETPHFSHDFTRYVSAISSEVSKKAGLFVDPDVFPDPDLL